MESKNELLVINGQLDLKVSKRLQEFEQLKKDIEAKRDAYVEIIKEAMEKNGITKFENEYVVINYIAETTATTLDSKALKEAEPETYTKFTRVSTKKAYIKIATKG